MSEEHNDFDGIKYRAEKHTPAIFRLLLGGLVVWGVIFMGYYLFSGWSSETEYAQKKLAQQGRVAAANKAGVPAPTAKPANQAGLIEIGKAQFAARCASCHGETAKGGIGPDLTKAQYKFGKSADAIAQSIVEGRPGGMPSFKNDLSQERVEGLVQYLMSLK
ncbi:c-type cytochrome [Geomesophilobacter sediminis]|uniref:Cytochrome c n=1 Tax=Geomesophilobacter sediminis TaxID=2798584 RepID=A0A8J7IWT8_9BACT|nr:cytochrome c [Geomesophilobacter sediminis]MBJ6724112.1 cytochrome c [Geomesophilobacter sediminis]